MTDNTRMVDLPWVDGTTRTVPEGTVYETESGLVYSARDSGYSIGLNPETVYGKRTYHHDEDSDAVRIFTEAPEPPVKVNVPTKIAAVVSLTVFPDDPGFVLTRDGWREICTGTEYDPSEIADRLRVGARVLFEGVDEDTP